MARTRYYCAASLDGYIAEADDTIEWLTGYEGRYEGNGAGPIEGGYDDFYAGIGALVIGAVTYEWILRHIEAAATGRTAESPAGSSGRALCPCRRGRGSTCGW